MSIRWKFLAYILSIEIVIFSTFGFTIFEFLYNKFLDSYKSHILSITKSTASIINSEKHSKLILENNVNNEDFKFYFSYMNKIFRSEDYISFFYTVEKNKLTNEFNYGIEAYTFPVDVIWVESNLIGFYIRRTIDNKLELVHDNYTYNNDFEFKFKDLTLIIKQEKINEFITSIQINEQEIIRLNCQSNPCKVEGVSILNEDQIVNWDVNFSSGSIKDTIFHLSYLPKNSITPPGNIYLDDITKINQYEFYIEQGIDFVDQSTHDSIYGTILSAYAPIKDSNGKTSGLVVVECYGNELKSLSSNFKKITIIIFFIIITLTVWITSRFSNSIINPILYLEKKLNEIGKGNFDISVELNRNDEFGNFARTLTSMIYDLKVSSQKQDELTTELRNTVNSYGNFVPHKFLDFLGKQNINQIELGDQIQREMTILFSDIRSFTSLSEKMSPRETFSFINSYLKIMEPIARKHNGFIDKFMGDGIMAIFPDSPDEALLAAITMQSEVFSYNAYRKMKDEKPIAIGVGLHTGNLILGIIGGEKRMEGTVISDAVNSASRLESITKIFGAGIVLSEYSKNLLKNPDHYNFRSLGKIQVKGKKETITIYECLMSMNDPIVSLKIDYREEFESGLEKYYEGNLSSATEIFLNIQKSNPTDKAIQFYLSRIKFYEKIGLPEDWAGIEEMESK